MGHCRLREIYSYYWHQGRGLYDLAGKIGEERTLVDLHEGCRYRAEEIQEYENVHEDEKLLFVKHTRIRDNPAGNPTVATAPRRVGVRISAFQRCRVILL